MIACVLSGGGGLGSIPAGVLEALHERDMVPYQRVRVDVLRVPENHPGVKLVSLPPVCSHASLKDLGRAASLIEQARSQNSLLLAGQLCDTCKHKGLGATTSPPRRWFV